MLWQHRHDRPYDSFHANRVNEYERREEGYDTVVFQIILRDGLKFDVEIDPEKYYELNHYYTQDPSNLNLKDFRSIDTVDGFTIDTHYIIGSRVKEKFPNTHTLVTKTWHEVYYKAGLFGDKEIKEFKHREYLEENVNTGK